MILRLCFSALALAAVTSASYAQTRPVRLSINNSPSVALKNNNAALAQNGLSIAYFANPAARLLQLRLAEPVLCASFVANPVAGQVRMRLVDTNGLIQGEAGGFPGLDQYIASTDSGGIRYVLDPADSSKRLLRVTTKPELKCYAFPGGSSALAAGQPAKAAPDGDVIFVNGFENTQVAGVDLATSISVPQSARAGDDVVYTVDVSNQGNGGGTEVQVRDYFPQRSSDPVGPVLQSGSWTCTASNGAACSEASGTGYVYQSAALIPSGGRLLISVRRRLDNSPVPGVGTSFRVQAAAFSRTAENEANSANNPAASGAISVINNSPPVVSGLANSSTLEDQTSALIPFTVTDSDGPNNPTVTVSSSDTSLVSSAGIVINGTGSNRSLSITPVANANGVATIIVSANDGVSAGSASFQFTVIARNDPPTFNAPSAVNFPANPAGVPRSINPILGNLSFGGADEAGQCLQSVTLSVRAGSATIFASAFAPGDPKTVTVSCAAANAIYALNGNSGTATIDIIAVDNGGTANGGNNTTSSSFTITVASAPPTIGNVPDQTLNEDNGLTGENSPLLVIGPLPVTLGGVGVNVNTAVLSAAVPADSVIPANALSLGGSGANRTLTITVPRHVYNAVSPSVGAPTRVTLTVSNGDASATDIVDVRLIAVNDPPTVSVQPQRDFPTPTAGQTQTVTGWITAQSPGPANEVTPPAGSGASPQVINFRTVQINNQVGPVIQETASTPALGVDGQALQVRWVTGTVPVGAACLQANLEDTEGGIASAAGRIGARGGDTACIATSAVPR